MGAEEHRSRPGREPAWRRAALAAVALTLAAAAARAGPYAEEGYAPALMAAWATSVEEELRGPVDIADPGAGDASFGTAGQALGPPGDEFDVVSLGDGGHVTLHFSSGISDGPGDDFAVYENGFETLDGLFGELAFVEVSQDGVQFFRFDAHTVNTTPVSGPSGDVIDPSDYHNFAGKHPHGEGTGFDLSELGLLEVHYVRLVDVIGAAPPYASYDHLGNVVYDPYETPWASGGFDLDAVGVLHKGPEPGALAGQLSCLAALAGLARRRRVALPGSVACGRGG